VGGVVDSTRHKKLSLHSETTCQIGPVVRLLAVRRRICHNDEYCIGWGPKWLAEAEKEGGEAVLDDACISCDLGASDRLTSSLYLVQHGGSCRAILSLEKGISP
jgi:hypothetical protein